MAKSSIRDYSTSAASNTDIGGIGTQGTNLVSNFDNAFREMMAQLANMNAGTSPIDDTFTLCDPADATKKFRIDVGAITTATTRVMTLPDANITISAFAATLLDDAAASNARTTLGLGTSAVINTGTSGTTIPLLDGANTWSNTQTISAASPILRFIDTDTSVQTSFSGDSAVGSFIITVDSGSAGSAPALLMRVKGVTKLTIAESLATFTTACALGGNLYSNGLSAVLDPTSVTTSGMTWDDASKLLVISNSSHALSLQRTSTDGPSTRFYRQTTLVGSISHTASATAYNTSSDGRAKKNRNPIANSASVIDALEPITYDWTHVDGSGVGFIAQDLYKIIPEAVTTGDDNASLSPGDADFEWWMVDMSKIVPYLVAEVKALRYRVAALEGK